MSVDTILKQVVLALERAKDSNKYVLSRIELEEGY
jgi:hypothetical protein